MIKSQSYIFTFTFIFKIPISSFISSVSTNDLTFYLREHLKQFKKVFLQTHITPSSHPQHPYPLNQPPCPLQNSICCKLSALPFQGFPGGLMVKNLPAYAGDRDFIPGLGRSPGKENGNLLQYSLFLPGKSNAKRRLVGCSLWGHQRVRHDLTTKQQGHDSYCTV